MKTLAFWGVLFLAAAVCVEGADRDTVEKEVAKLQADLSNLEADLEAGGGEPGLSASLGDRVQRVREEVIYLKVRMRKHRDAGGEGVGVPLDEIKALRLDIADLRNDLRGHLRPKETSRERDLTLPSGTEFSVRLETSLSSASAEPGDRFTAATVEPIARAGVVVVDAGSFVEGRIEVVDRAEGRTDRKARLVLAFNRMEVKGNGYPLTATVTGASEKMETGIGDEKAKLGVGAGLGTILGAVIGGKKGAVIGAVLGGSGAILATEGKEVELPAGTILKVRLDRELTLPIT